MLSYLKQTKLANTAPLSLVLLIISALLGTSHILPSILPYFVLLICGMGALCLQYNPAIIKLIFARPKRKVWWKVIPIVIITMIIAYIFVIVGTVLFNIPVDKNDTLGNGDKLSKLVNLFWVSISLIGEEVITASLTFPIYTLTLKKFGNQKAWVFAAIVGSLLFGLLHFRVYHWNLYQMFFPIGLGRLPFTWLWLNADSLWPAIVAHILYDLILFIPLVVN